MRHEIQPWDRVRAQLEVIVAGAGQTGLTPLCAIQRKIDGYWLANGGGSWAAGFAVNTMTAVNAVTQPGLYEYAVPTGQLTYVQGAEGYRIVIAETTQPLLEYVSVDVGP